MEPVDAKSLLLTSVTAALVSGAVAWAYEAVRSHFRRARLGVDGCEYHDDGQQRFFYLTVTNRGRITARACVPQLTLHLKTWDKVLPGGYFNQSSIDGHGSAGLNNIATVWQRSDRPMEVSIHPGQSQRIEVAAVRIANGEWIFTIPSEAGYDRPHMRFGGVGFEYIARVGSDNAKPVLCFGQVLNAGAHPPTIEISSQPTASFAWKPPPLLTRARRRLAHRICHPVTLRRWLSR